MWEVFHEVKAFLIFISLIVYLCVSRCYHYRVRDETVNERFLVEEIYERELNNAEEYQKQRCNENLKILMFSRRAQISADALYGTT